MGPYLTRKSLPTISCHNCRRKRWMCDRSVPTCNKCRQAGQTCLGYDKLFLWTNGVASRGKMTGKSFPTTSGSELQVGTPRTCLTSQAKVTAPTHGNIPILAQIPCWYQPLGDPVFQDLSKSAKFYLCYYDRQVCKDLVLQDLPTWNPFRDLLPLAGNFAVLLHIVVAVSALHLANASQISAQVRSSKFSPRIKKGMMRREDLQGTPLKAYRDALLAKQKALHALCRVVTEQDSVGVDIVLASIMLFIKFELLDSGKNDWRFHVEGARQLIAYLNQGGKIESLTPNGLRNCIISNCAIYDVLGTTLNNSSMTEVSSLDTFDVGSIRIEDQVNTCLSCPPILLQVIRDVSHSLRSPSSNNTQEIHLGDPTTQQCTHLLSIIDAFNPSAWARSLQHVSASFDLKLRTHIGSAYKAAVKIYVSRALLHATPTSLATNLLENHVSEVIYHLEFIPSDDPYFKATCWPSLIAGAETDNPSHRAWVLSRFEVALETLPWGYLYSALEILNLVWATKSEDSFGGGNWIKDLKVLENDWLIA